MIWVFIFVFGAVAYWVARRDHRRRLRHKQRIAALREAHLDREAYRVKGDCCCREELGWHFCGDEGCIHAES